MGKCSFLGNIIDIIMGMFGGLLLKLVLMVLVGGLLDAPSRQDCRWYAVPEVLMTALQQSTILGP